MCFEFVKRMDPELPFYYHTSAHQRFYEGEMPSFSEIPKKTRKQKRAPRRELVGDVGRRVSFPVQRTSSIHASFHNAPVSLPPLPDACSSTRVLAGHAYSADGPS